MIDQDEYNPVLKNGEATLSIDSVGTRYAMAMTRTFADPNDPDDMRMAHELQDAIQIRQASAGTLELPDWDQQSLVETRKQLNQMALKMNDFSQAFGRRGEVDPVQHLIGSASGWGGNRPGRHEPRAIKRRQAKYPKLKVPRPSHRCRKKNNDTPQPTPQNAPQKA